MAELDTSGEVVLPRELHDGKIRARQRWQDLTPFAQGYIEALFAGPATWTKNGEIRSLTVLAEWAGFSDLAPEALAMILRDCEAAPSPYTTYPGGGGGLKFYLDRQRGDMADIFPPLRVYLNDDGKVMLEAADAPHR